MHQQQTANVKTVNCKVQKIDYTLNIHECCVKTINQVEREFRVYELQLQKDCFYFSFKPGKRQTYDPRT